ncbi:hypothetical protein HGRIS_002553 [Hohenbuehelia grisea]|uniref:Uncharacterized protein n=1 Tax=Hohenbuehelia grisea TaxID=104357 RepID=A0ABR3JLI8_9AGAR
MAQLSKRKKKVVAAGDENDTNAASLRQDKESEANEAGSLPLRISRRAMTNCTNRPERDGNENPQPDTGIQARTSNPSDEPVTPARIRQEAHGTPRDCAARTRPTATARRINGVNEEVSEQATRKKAAHQQTQPSNGLRRTNDNSPPAHDTSSTRNPRHLDDELTELQKRLAEHERREHEIIKRERQLQLRERELAKQAHHNEATACRERVEVLRKPKGEAGDSKRGFQLQDAMGLGDSEDGDMRYNEFLHTNRQNAHKAGIDLNLTYRQQDPAALAKLFKLNRMAIPYLTRERFPNDWPQVEALKQYIRNARRGIARKQRGRTENRKKRNADDAEGEDDVDETSARGNPSKRRRYADQVDENGAGPSRLRPVEDDDDDDEQDGGNGQEDPFATDDEAY